MPGKEKNPQGDGAKLADSNMANYGGKDHHSAAKKAAETEKEYKGAGQKPGLEIWRVENRRTEADTPDFGVKRWPKEEYGKFYSGDSYVVLHTYKTKDPLTGKPTDKLAWDVHFWIGKESSQDEYGVAAYKTVELDDLLDSGPVQHRELQNHESQLFKSYFPKGIIYMDGGIDSGFRHVGPKEYKPRLFQIRADAKRQVKLYQIPIAASNLNHGDCFVLDAGLTVYTYIGKDSDAFEKSRAAALATDIKSGRGGAKVSTTADAAFWKILNGSEKDVKPAASAREPEQVHEIDRNNLTLMKLSDASGKLTFSKEAQGSLQKSQLQSSDVFIVDATIQVFVWVGKAASTSEKSQAMKYATQFIKDSGKPDTTPVTVIKEGQIHHVFQSLFGEKGGEPVARGGGGGCEIL